MGISSVLSNITTGLDSHLRARLNVNETMAVLGYPLTNDGAPRPNTANRLLLCVVGVEDRASPAPNLTVTVTLAVIANFDVVEEGLKFLSAATDFLRFRTSLGDEGVASLPDHVRDLMITRLYHGVEDTGKIMSLLGIRYLPSAFYTITFKHSPPDSAPAMAHPSGNSRG
jgi:hypothetical protein